MSRRLLRAPLLLIPVLVLSAEACPPNMPDCLKLPNNHLILVMPDGKVSLDVAHVSRTMYNQVVWLLVSPTGGKLSIQFQVPPDKKPPFENMNSLGGGKYEPSCFQQSGTPIGTVSLCVSGKIAADASYDFTYLYDQVITIADNTTVKDAGIIIER